jgi:predicted dehydrogenase
MSAAQPLRVGIVGYGLAGRVFHGALLAADPAWQVDAVVTRDPDRSAQVADAHPGAQVVASVDELWGRDLDLVVVATPNDTHVETATRALRAGVAVVVDKPLATSSADARALVELAETLGRPLTVYQNRRWDGDFLTASRLAASGDLGEVHTVESRFEPWKLENRAGWKRRATAADGGGILFDLGPHLVDQASVLLGPVLTVHAEITTRRPGGSADDDVFLSLGHEGGRRSRLTMSHVAAVPGPRFRVLGSSGAYEVHGLDPQEAQLASGVAPTDPAYGVDETARRGVVITDGSRRDQPTDGGRYPDFYSQLARALRGDGELPVDPWDAVRGLEVIEAARRSADEGRVVRP